MGLCKVTLSPTFHPIFLARTSPTIAPRRLASQRSFSAVLMRASSYTWKNVALSTAMLAKNSRSCLGSLPPNQVL